MLNQAFLEAVKREEFDGLNIPLDNLDNVQAVPADDFFLLHEFLDKKRGPGFSVRAGHAMKIEDYGVLGLSWRTCTNAGEIFERSERYFKMLSNTYVFKVEKEDQLSHIYLLREPHRRGLELSNEATLSATVVVLQAMTESDIHPTQVSFKHSAPSDLSSYKTAFKCPILFEQDVYSITYKTEDLNTRTAKADASINQFLLERVDEETKGIKVSSNKIIGDVTQLIKNALPSGIPSVNHIASQLGMSNRTLTRRLSESGVTFRDLIRQTQEEGSKLLLKQTNRTISEIAFENGFSEQSAFNRAFKRWTGISPLEFRKK